MEQLRGLIGVTAYCNFDPAFRRRQLQSNGFTSGRDAGSFQNRTRLVRRVMEGLQLYKRAKRTTRNSSFASKAKTARVREYKKEGFQSSPVHLKLQHAASVLPWAMLEAQNLTVWLSRMSLPEEFGRK